ncbi:MAG: YlbF family regulator [Planctomycetes bacterium]|nr:YlbF family regulator [Planctomycetota bacterium]
MKEIIELAGSLGKAIAASPAAANLRAARAELEKHAGVLETLKQYQQQADRVAKLEDENKPIEVADKHALQDLHDKLVSSDIFKKFTASQMEYIDLMRKVSDAMRSQLSETEKA